MKKIMITLAGALIALATHAQSVLLVETEKGSTQYVYGKSAEISFLGLPNGDEVNGDLTVSVESVSATGAFINMHATASTTLDDVGLCITETENEQPNYTNPVAQGNSIQYSSETPYYSMKEKGDDAWGNLQRCLSPDKTYYVKPYALLGNKLMFGSEKAFKTLLNVQKFISDATLFADWYADTELKTAGDVFNGIYIVPTALAWEAYCEKYQAYLGGKVQSATAKKVLTSEWFKHLSVAEADLMKAYAMQHNDSCEGGEVYVVDRLCDDFLPNLLKASADIKLEEFNWTESKQCWPTMVECDESYGIENDQYMKAIAYDEEIQLVYDLPITLLPNRKYNLTVTIAPNTIDIENAVPNLFSMELIGGTEYISLTNPDTSGSHGMGTQFIYGGKSVETFTIPISTEDEQYWATQFLRFTSNVTEEQMEQYSNELCIAKISLAPMMEDAVQGDVDMDGTLNQDDVQSVAAVVVLNSDKSEGTQEEQPSADFTGDGKTLIDDVVALVNYIQTGEFQPNSSKVRARDVAATAPFFTSEKNLSITAGKSTTMSVDMSGMADYTAVSFDIKVPQGVRIAIDQNGKPKVALGSIATATHHVTVATQEDGQTISVACFAEDNASFAQNVGSIITVDLTADTSIEPNEDAQISLNNCMTTKRTLTSAMLDEYLINAGIVNSIKEINETNGANASTIVAYYSINGIQISRPQKGINLVRMSDGSMRKVLFK